MVNEKDKINARDGSLKSTEEIEFKCDKGHIYEQIVYNHIKLSTGDRKKGCPICGKTNRVKNLQKLFLIRGCSLNGLLRN